MVYGLKKYRQHLFGWKIVVCTDHAALTFLKKTPEPIGHKEGGLTFCRNTTLISSTGPAAYTAIAMHYLDDLANEAEVRTVRNAYELSQDQGSSVGTPAPGLVQPSDNPRPSPPNSFWEELYDLPQWFVTDPPKVDSSVSSSFLSSPTSSTSTNQVAIPDGPISPDAPLSDSPATNTVT